MGVFGCAGDWYYPRGFVQQPSECHLRGGHTPFPAELLELVDYTCIGAYYLRPETRYCVAVVVVDVKTGVLIYAPAEKNRG